MTARTKRRLKTITKIHSPEYTYLKGELVNDIIHNRSLRSGFILFSQTRSRSARHYIKNIVNKAQSGPVQTNVSIHSYINIIHTRTEILSAIHAPGYKEETIQLLKKRTPQLKSQVIILTQYYTKRYMRYMHPKISKQNFSCNLPQTTKECLQKLTPLSSPEHRATWCI